MFREKYTKAVPLDGEWQGVFLPTEMAPECASASELPGDAAVLPCTVPGNIELDLQRAGLCEDPFYGMNPVSVSKQTEHLHAYYFTTFTAEQADGIPSLVFDGVDCFSDVYLNGTLIGQTESMLIPYRFDVSDALKIGENELFVHIYPAVECADDEDYGPSAYAQTTNFESLYIRKPGHMFGWDIMPRFVSAGIWRPVRLEWQNETRIEDCYLTTENLNNGANLRMWFKLRVPKGSYDGYRLTLTGRCGDAVFTQESPVFYCVGTFGVHVPDPKLWWPRGSGEQNLYDCTLSLTKDGKELSARSFRLGIRTVELFRREAATNEPNPDFAFIVNGRRIFMKGTNWVPADAFHSRDSRRIPQLTDMAADLNCNMIRCWGGNVYESDDFYDRCDRLGILIWQDFAMGCGYYPQTESFSDILANEVKITVKRLRQHCCIAMWAGDNECDMFQSWSSYPIDPNKNVLTRRVIPEMLHFEDPIRPYLPSSPYFSPEVVEKHLDLPEKHLWGDREFFKNPFFTDAGCSFVSEAGFFGVPSPESMAKFISPEKLWPCTNEEWMLHGTSPVPESHQHEHRIGMALRQNHDYFNDEGETLIQATKMNQAFQAEALKFLIEFWRSCPSKRSGLLWWNLADGWPQVSDAVVDYYDRKKLAYYFIKQSQQQVVLVLQEPANFRQQLTVINDTGKPVSLHYSVTDLSTGATVTEGDCTCGEFAAVADIPAERRNKTCYLIEWSGDACGKNHYIFGMPGFDFDEYWSWLRATGLYDEFLAESDRW